MHSTIDVVVVVSVVAYDRTIDMASVTLLHRGARKEIGNCYYTPIEACVDDVKVDRGHLAGFGVMWRIFVWHNGWLLINVRITEINALFLLFVYIDHPPIEEEE